MTRHTFILFLFVLVAGLWLSACETTGLGPLRAEIAEYDYTLHEPPRTDRGPGWTFQIIKTMDGKLIPATVCSNLYEDVQIIPSNVSLPDIKVASNISINLGLDFLSGLIASPVSAKSNLSDIKNVEIKWGAMQSYTLAKEQQFTETGEIRDIHKSCQRALIDLKKRGALKDKVFVVISALSTAELKYNFKRKSGAETDVSVNWAEKLGLKAGVQYSDDGGTTLTISKLEKPRYIGFQAVAIRDWVPTGLLTAASAKAKASKINALQMGNLLQTE